MNFSLQLLLNTIKSQSDFLLSKGYSITLREKGITYSKNTPEITYIIEFSTPDYSDLVISGLSTKTIFSEVEIPISDATGQELENTIYYIANPSSDITLKTKRTTNNIHFTISNTDDINRFITYFESFYFDEVVHFQETYSTINEVNKWLESTDYKMHPKLLNNGDGTFMFRKLLILNFNDSTEFSGLYDQYKEYLRGKAQNGETPFITLYNSFKKLEHTFTDTQEA